MSLSRFLRRTIVWIAACMILLNGGWPAPVTAKTALIYPPAGEHDQAGPFSPLPALGERPGVRAASITVSGVVTGPGGPVAQASVWVWSETQHQETTTSASGSYSVTLPAGSWVEIVMRPPRSTMLAQANCRIDGISGNVVQNFTVVAGHLLSLRPLGKNGQVIHGWMYLSPSPLINSLPSGWYFDATWDGDTQRFEAVLPPDIYTVAVRNPPSGYYESTAQYDLRSADQVADLAISTSYVPPYPYDPPVAAKITIGAPDGLGEALVTGAPGAALPLVHVLLVNLNSAHQVYTVSGQDGSFSARIFAPPGSAILVKHGPANWRWSDLPVGLSEGVNPYPGTILSVPETPSGADGRLAFGAAGAVQALIDDPNTTRNYVGAAWALAGSLERVSVDGEWTRPLSGQYNGQTAPGLYLGGLNWTHPAFGDLDGDGDLDLVVGERSGTLVLYRNAGSASIPGWQFASSSFAGVDTGSWAYPALADLTGDGALDLVVGNEGGQVRIFYNTGAAAAPAWPAAADVTLSAGTNAAPALNDLDGDGDLDLVVGHSGGTLAWFKNTGTLQAPVWTAQAGGYAGISEAVSWFQPAFVDLDGDADRDLLLGLCGGLLWYRRAGSAASPTWTRVNADPIGYGEGSCATSPGVGDWNGDGRADLAIGEHWGVLRFFRNTGASAWTETGFDLPFDLHGETAPALGDWDADGDLDLLVGQVHGQVHQYTNIGSSAQPDWRPDGQLLTLAWTDHPHAYPALADIDGDDDLDLFVGEGGWQADSGAGGNLHYYRNDGTPTVPNWQLVSDTFLGLDVGGFSTPAFADLDADGDLDLFVGSEAGDLAFVQNTGSAGAPAWAAPVQPYAGLQLGARSAPAFIDLDADGDLDLLSGQENGSLAYVRNTGSVTVPEWDLVSTSYPGIDIGELSIPAAGDLSGDGKPDLLLGDIDGGVDRYVYTGPGTPPASGSAYAAGEIFQVRGQLHIYSQAISAATDPSAIGVNGYLYLLKQHDAQGNPLCAESYFMSTLLAPTGFPIQSPTRPLIDLHTEAAIGAFSLSGDHALEADLAVAGQIPADLPDGIYRPVILFEFSGVPTDTTEWLAANVTYHTFYPREAALPPVTVGQVDSPRLVWRLLMDDFVQGTRGAAAREDAGTFELASQIASQGAQLILPPLDERSGQALEYRLEPFLPMISYTDRRMPTPPLIPFDLPGGSLHVTIQYPDGTQHDLGTEALAQSFNRTKTTRAGQDLNSGTVQLEDVYSLKAASDRFRVTFSQYGHYVITMTGSVQDVWGNTYTGGGTYDVWVAHPLDLDPGVLPGTPLAVGDPFNPALQLSPGVPADVTLTITQYPDSDPAQKTVQTISGQANAYGYFNPTQTPPRMNAPGEYRVDLTAGYTDDRGELYLASLTWGGIVMTPASQAQLIAHGRRGLDSLQSIPNPWFVSSRDLTIPSGSVSHSLNPYYNGDIFWSRMSDNPYGGDSLILGASVQDQIGLIKAAIQARALRMNPALTSPGSRDERFDQEEIPLFISTGSGLPPAVVPEAIDQLAYSYRSSQRPGVRVREVVAEDGHSGGYWRLDTLYDDQLSVGIQGDLPNDYKFQYVGAVYRDLESGHNEYLGQGSGWIFIPEDDALGSRVMPPFAGQGNGGWTTEGGPILTLKGEAIDIFILPTGVQAGSVLEVGERFRFAGHVMPTLDSQVSWTATAPNGTQHTGGGRANSIGYFYDPAGDFSLDQAGLWSVDVSVWHNGVCSGGQTVSPYPSGDVLGSDGGRYWFYVVPAGAPYPAISSPLNGFLTFESQVTPVAVQGSLPAGWSAASLDYTIRMPGYILEHGQAAVNGSAFQLTFDPAALAEDFPNLDLYGRETQRAGLADTFTISLLLRGQIGGQAASRAMTITLQGEQVYVQGAGESLLITLPLINK